MGDGLGSSVPDRLAWHNDRQCQDRLSDQVAAFTPHRFAQGGPLIALLWRDVRSPWPDRGFAPMYFGQSLVQIQRHAEGSRVSRTVHDYDLR